MTQILTSLWDGLSPHLVASIYQVRRGSSGWEALPDASRVVVKAVITEASMEVALGWQSRFEDSDTDSQFPTTAAALQAGYPQQLIDALLGDSSVGKSAKSIAGKFIGRTGITKLNSTQVFSGMEPVKITATLLLRAWKDPVSEVEKPFDQLMNWSLPVSLSTSGSVIGRIADSGAGLVETLMPSLAPIQIALDYKGRHYSPLVIESIGNPMDSPVDVNGNHVQMLIPVTMATLTAIDRADWAGSSIRI